MFFSRLQGAYHDLAEYGDIRTDESKVDTLITKVSGDSSLSPACTFIRNDAQSGDFTAAIQYLSNEVLAKNRVVNTNNTRNISSTSRKNTLNRNNGVTNQGSGNPNPNTTDRYSKEGNIFLNDGSYSNHIWWNVLNEDERNYCEPLRQRR